MTPPNDSPATKKERREAAREKARITREAEARRRRRNKWLVQGGLVLGVVAVLAIVGLVISQSIKPAGPGPANMASDGLLLEGSNGAVTAVPSSALAADATPTPAPSASGDVPSIVVYLDYMCPYCGQFDTTNAAQLEEAVSSGAATLAIHPIGFLDNASQGSRYSTRAANAFVRGELRARQGPRRQHRPVRAATRREHAGPDERRARHPSAGRRGDRRPDPLVHQGR